MKFGPVPIGEAEGAILAHGVDADRRLRKGHVLRAADIEALRAAGHSDIVVARLEAEDVAENEAASTLARALTGGAIVAENAATGRCNLHATRDGLFLADRGAIDSLNTVDPGITLATLPDATPVKAGRMVATVKIIPFAVRRTALKEAVAAASDVLRVHPFRQMRVALVSTLLPTLKPSVVEKTERVTAQRLLSLGSRIVSHERVAHERAALAATLRKIKAADLLIVFGASAVADEDDVIPAAIRDARGELESVGMPVDPGNLICCGTLGSMPVIGAPGCARSSAENGFDWVLQRIAAGLPVTDGWVRSLGVGGLLMEIGSRPSPRDGQEGLAVVVLAAGSSRRMGPENKLLKTLGGKPLAAHAVGAATEADVGPVTVVTGHEAERVETVLADFDVAFARNGAYADGMSTSLRAGIEAASGASGALVMLADMPDVTAAGLKELAQTFAEHGGGRVIAARDRVTGRRGNPVIWPASMFDALCAIEGDKGARDLLERNEADVLTVDLDGAALDLDTPEAFEERLTR